MAAVEQGTSRLADAELGLLTIVEILGRQLPWW